GGDAASGEKRTALGARLFETRAEVVFRQREAATRAPFRALETKEAAGSAHAVLRLGGQVEGSVGFVLRLRFRSSSAAPNPGDGIERALVARGHERGRGLVIDFDNLDELLPDADERHAFVAGPLAARFAAASATRTVDPGPTLRGRAAFLRSATDANKRAAPRVWHSREGRPSGLGLQTTIVDAQQRESLHMALADEFLAGIEWPLPAAPEGLDSLFRVDDLPTRGGLHEHDALDCGALISREDARLHSWPSGTEIRAPHRSAMRVAALREASIAWRVNIRRGDACLALWIGASHVDPRPRSLRGYNGSDDPWGWESAAPAMRALGVPKGNHLHLEVLGLHEDAAVATLLLATHVRAALQRAARRCATRGPLEPVALQGDHGDALGEALARVASALPALPGLVVLPGALSGELSGTLPGEAMRDSSDGPPDSGASGDRFELRAPPLALDLATDIEAKVDADKARLRLASGDVLELGPLLPGAAPRLRPGRVTATLTPAPDSLIAGLRRADQEALIARILRRLATSEGEGR
nr:hypothetical protein [Planctomycetota bacterium]